MELKKSGTKYQIIGMDALELLQLTDAIDHWNNNHRTVGKPEMTFEVPVGLDLEIDMKSLHVKAIKYPSVLKEE